MFISMFCSILSREIRLVLSTNIKWHPRSNTLITVWVTLSLLFQFLQYVLCVPVCVCVCTCMCVKVVACNHILLCCFVIETDAEVHYKNNIRIPHKVSLCFITLIFYQKTEILLGMDPQSFCVWRIKLSCNSNKWK